MTTKSSHGTAPIEQITTSPSGTSVSYLVSNPTGVQGVYSANVGSLGAIQEMATYSPYGQQSITSGTDVTPFGFQGSYTDPSGLVYLINRYYDPSTDQFLSVDPMVDTTGQAYGFVNDNPLNGTDSLGLSPIAAGGNTNTDTIEVAKAWDGEKAIGASWDASNEAAIALTAAAETKKGGTLASINQSVMAAIKAAQFAQWYAILARNFWSQSIKISVSVFQSQRSSSGSLAPTTAAFYASVAQRAASQAIASESPTTPSWLKAAFNGLLGCAAGIMGGVALGTIETGGAGAPAAALVGCGVGVLAAFGAAQ